MSRPSRRWTRIVSNRPTTSTSSAAAARAAAGPGSSGNCSRVLSPNLLKLVTVPPHRRTYRSHPRAKKHHLRKANTASPTGAWPARRPGEVAPLDPVAEVSGHVVVAHRHLGASRRCSSGAPPSAKEVRGAHHPNKPPRPRPSGLRYQAPFAPFSPRVSRARPTRRA